MTTQEVIDTLLHSHIEIRDNQNDDNGGRKDIGQLVYYGKLETDKKGFVGKVILFIKRVIRKLVRFVIEPICIQQSSINKYHCREIEVLQEELYDCKVRIEKLEHK